MRADFILTIIQLSLVQYKPSASFGVVRARTGSINSPGLLNVRIKCSHSVYYNTRFLFSKQNADNSLHYVTILNLISQYPPITIQYILKLPDTQQMKKLSLQLLNQAARLIPISSRQLQFEYNHKKNTPKLRKVYFGT